MNFNIPSTANAALEAELVAAINNKTKPLGSLGRLELLAAQIGLVQQSTTPVLREPSIIVFAGDHGVVAEGISAFPQDVTWQMVENFLADGAAINVFARQNGIALHVVDTGVNHDFGVRDRLINMKVAPGTQNFARGAAMSAAQCEAAMKNGRDVVQGLAGNVVGFGEMGIGNTTAAAALMHKLTGVPVADCVGAGTGLTSDGIRHKQAVIEAAVALHANAILPASVLATFGGFEIATMVGAMLAAAERRMVLLIDGFIVTSALLVAARMQPAVLDYCVFSHQSDESGHARMLQALRVKPVLQLDLRLGEGTGAALVYPVVQAAVNFLNQMATFASAQVSEKSSN
ncbi:nicotinate-nucleotide--dimethylbenzimidazole phosphoribosyltransferase [Undibacterium sp. TS12]|uniref:nicotinate-nucleotide--dimethylbenzimidazole phosphoribosyltransferase n=1 Tax=Undibacterium sp. TS12 TaxID=2908202 RepID=UPI001F4CAD8E|nr:nicotinate-nucleotide--dimethylbenzimidazole phosphoribosyltransferase [Undibacterium sp. TS12]MCH8622108.1 nicotinate-nucleotide--dimethylbenzimidazole phosphoribosyltransferase [Undibacterium sp. TS12]